MLILTLASEKLYHDSEELILSLNHDRTESEASDAHLLKRGKKGVVSTIESCSMLNLDAI